MEKEKCIGCEKQFPEDQISHSSGEPMCDECEKGFHKEIKDSGIEKLDEYLSSRGLQEDFNIFCQAKFSGTTEEEICEMSENIDHEYERWNLQELKNVFPLPSNLFVYFSPPISESKEREAKQVDNFGGLSVSIIENNIACQDGKALLMLSSNDYKIYKNKLSESKNSYKGEEERKGDGNEK